MHPDVVEGVKFPESYAPLRVSHGYKSGRKKRMKSLGNREGEGERKKERFWRIKRKGNEM